MYTEKYIFLSDISKSIILKKVQQVTFGTKRQKPQLAFDCSETSTVLFVIFLGETILAVLTFGPMNVRRTGRRINP